jgi:hypothetical protein
LRLWDGKSNFRGKEKYICHAVLFTKIESQRAKDLAAQMAELRLVDHATLEGWMYTHHPHLDINNTVMMQRTRHAWLDSMIAELEA